MLRYLSMYLLRWTVRDDVEMKTSYEIGSKTDSISSFSSTLRQETVLFFLPMSTPIRGPRPRPIIHQCSTDTIIRFCGLSKRRPGAQRPILWHIPLVSLCISHVAAVSDGKCRKNCVVLINDLNYELKSERILNIGLYLTKLRLFPFLLTLFNIIIVGVMFAFQPWIKSKQ